MENLNMNPTTFDYIHKRALETAGALGHLRGTIIGEMLYEYNITPSKFKHLYEAYKRSYELGGDTMDEFDTSRIQKRADELGATI
jgi:hypothetical protein